MRGIEPIRRESPVARPWDPLRALDSVMTLTPCRCGQEIYGQEDPAECWYRVVCGALRRFAVRPDGRRQIVDFLLPGDFFGLVLRDEHRFAVEAIAKGTVVARYPRRQVEALADSDPEVGRLIREVAFETISRAQARTLILGRTTAAEKVGSFLLEMAERWAGATVDAFVLPMSRYDIADYLALAAETVSRALTDLTRRGAIALVRAHRVRIVDRDALTLD